MARVCEHCGSVIDAEPKVVRFAGLVLDETRKTLACGPNAVPATKKEAELLADLMTGRLTTREAIMMRHLDETSDNPEKGVDVMIHKLRRKLKAVGSASQIVTVRQVGYQLIAEREVVNTSDSVTYGDTTLNVRRRSLTCGPLSAPLRPQTARIMEELMRDFSAPERQLIDRYIGKSGDRIKNLRVQMTYIRRALHEIGSGVEIVNTRGEGYWVRMRPVSAGPRARAKPLVLSQGMALRHREARKDPPREDQHP
jgi:DNA-binding response OmpR family regulator